MSILRYMSGAYLVCAASDYYSHTYEIEKATRLIDQVAVNVKNHVFTVTKNKLEVIHV